MGDASREAIDALAGDRTGDLAPAAGRAMAGYRDLGLVTPELNDIVEALTPEEGVLAAKISGSGLGDCAVAIGSDHAMALPYASIRATISEEGVRIDHV